MSEWKQVEDAVVAAVAALSDAGGPLLATVRGHTARERRALAAEIVRELLPAAYVMAAGRSESDKNFRRPGAAEFTLLLASRSERDSDEARKGGTDVTGVFAIASTAAAALGGLDLGNNRRLLLVDERAVSADDSLALWEQHYEIRTRPGLFAPTFGGYPLIGEAGEVQVEIGPLSRAVSQFAFPGVDGTFERMVGTRERTIVWRGQLEATDDWSLDSIENEIEDIIKSGRVDTLFDASSRTFDNCVLNTFKRRGPRRKDPLTGVVVQEFEMGFIQLIA